MDLNCNYDVFEEIFVTVLNKHTSQKTKLVRGNEKPHMNKDIKRAIMKRSKLRNIFRKTKLPSDSDAYKNRETLLRT